MWATVFDILSKLGFALLLAVVGFGLLTQIGLSAIGSRWQNTIGYATIALYLLAFGLSWSQYAWFGIVIFFAVIAAVQLIVALFA